MKFYSKYSDTRFVMPKGKVLQFHGGEFETNDKDEISELSGAVKISQEVLSLVPMKLILNDAHLLREVGHNTGAVSSATLAQLAARSG